MASESLGTSLQRLWDRARQISELVHRLRSENASLKHRLEEVEQSGRQLEKALGERTKELTEIRERLATVERNGDNIFTKEEKEALATRIKELITKLNARL